MDSPLSSIFKDICREVGCNEEDSLPALKILRDIKNINVDLWRSLNLPLNLYFILVDKIKQIEEKQEQGFNPFIMPSTSTYTQPTQQVHQVQQIQPSTTISTNITKPSTISTITSTPSNIITISKTEEQKYQPTQTQIVEQEVKEEDILKTEIYKVLENIMREINDRDKVKEVLKKLHTIVMNIVSNPEDIKYRKLKIDSKFFEVTIKPYINTYKFLEVLKFIKIGDYMEYVGDDQFIIKVAERMNDYLIENKIAELNFNPYQSSIIGTGGSNLTDMKKVIETPDFDELIRKERERREEIIKSSKIVERNTKIFQAQSGMGTLMQTLNEEDQKENSKKVEEEDFYKYAMSIVKGNTDKFVIKRRTEFENLIKKPIYTQATLRIKFPNEFLLQGNFALMETIGDMYDWIRQNLNDPTQEFYLYTSFPKKMYTDLKSTVYSQGLAPSTLLNIGFKTIDPRDVNYKYLNDESLQKFVTEF